MRVFEAALGQSWRSDPTLADATSHSVDVQILSPGCSPLPFRPPRHRLNDPLRIVYKPVEYPLHPCYTQSQERPRLAVGLRCYARAQAGNIVRELQQGSDAVIHGRETIGSPA